MAKLMDRLADKRADRSTNRSTNTQTNRQICRQMNKPTKRRLLDRMSARTGRRDSNFRVPSARIPAWTFAYNSDSILGCIGDLALTQGDCGLGQISEGNIFTAIFLPPKG